MGTNMSLAERVVMAEVAVGKPKLAVSTKERMLVAFEIDVAKGRADP
jgi:hypothetical protein